MRTKNNINNTLEKSLFTSPTPIKNKKEYFELFDFIFPSKDIFIAFLKEENFDQQIFYAEKILLRLSYDSFFGVPSRLFSNLLAMENHLSGKENEGYAGRDHYVHIVHLYLLGIYTFFYHQILNENIFAEFKKKRKVTNIKSNNAIKSIVKDFIVAWRYFVIYHDISYPIEYLLGNENVKELDKEEYLRAFNNISKSIGKDLSLKSLAKFIGIYKLIKSVSDYSFKNLLSSCIDKDASELYSYSNFFLIEKIFGYETYRDVYALLEKQNIVAVLYEKKTMSAMLIFIPEKTSDGLTLTPIETVNYKNNKYLNEIKKSPNAPYNKSYFNLNNYSWEYFINSSVKLQELIQSIFPGISLNEFDETINYVHEQTSSDYSMVFSDSDFKQYCFNIYSVLYNLAGYQKLKGDEKETDSHFSHLSKIVGDIGKEIPKRISKIFEDILSQELIGIDFDEDMDNKQTIEGVIYSYLIKISKSYKGLANEIAKPLKSEIMTQYKLKRNLRIIRESIKTVFENKGIESKLKIDIGNDSLIYNDLLGKNSELYTKVLNQLNLKIEKSELINLLTLIKYKPSFSKYDHGIVSGLVFLSIIDIYKQLLYNAKKDNNFNKLLSVAIGLDFENDMYYLDYKVNDIFIETSYAILTHNIYPKIYSENTNFKTKLHNNPFAYFAILLDSLQPWDRKVQINQGYNELPYQTLSRGFDIQVKNNKIRISEFDHRIDIQKRFNEMKKQLNDYIENASNFIELNFGEF